MTRPPSPSKKSRAGAKPSGQAPEARVEVSEADPDPAGRLLQRVRDREGSRPDSRPPATDLVVGAKVTVQRGSFAGRSGVIQELDGRGGARVMLGLLSARIDLKDLALMAEGKGERLTLSSSHRKPR